MEQHDEELVKALAPQIPELKEAYERHVKLKQRVEELSERSLLTQSEEVEKKDLQKRKLIEKDRIMQILAEHQEASRA